LVSFTKKDVTIDMTQIPMVVQTTGSQVPRTPYLSKYVGRRREIRPPRTSELSV